MKESHLVSFYSPIFTVANPAVDNCHSLHKLICVKWWYDRWCKEDKLSPQCLIAGQGAGGETSLGLWRLHANGCPQLQALPSTPLLLIHHNGSAALWKDFPKCRCLFGLLWTECVPVFQRPLRLGRIIRGHGWKGRGQTGEAFLGAALAALTLWNNLSSKLIFFLCEFWWGFSVMYNLIKT